MKYIRADRSIVEKIEHDFGKEQADYLHFDDGFTFAASEGDNIAGFISTHIGKLPYIENTFENYIDVIEVRPEYRG